MIPPSLLLIRVKPIMLDGSFSASICVVVVVVVVVARGDSGRLKPYFQSSLYLAGLPIIILFGQCCFIFLTELLYPGWRSDSIHSSY